MDGRLVLGIRTHLTYKVQDGPLKDLNILSVRVLSKEWKLGFPEEWSVLISPLLVFRVLINRSSSEDADISIAELHSVLCPAAFLENQNPAVK